MNVLEAILAVFLSVAEWIGTGIQALIPIFWIAETGLTFIGVLSVAGLAFAVVFLLLGIIQSFMRFRS